MKLLIITGASSGIGLSTAERFLAEGYTVVNLSRRRCPATAVNHINCDLSVAGFLDTITGQLTPLLKDSDQICLIHNASRLEHDSAVETASNHFREVLETNLVAPNTLNYFIIPYMKAGSSVLYVGSTLSEKAVPGSFTYVVSKHAQLGMMRATCQDTAGRHIHTLAVCPGFTDTEMLRTHIPPEALESVAGLSSFGRLVEPAEIASVLFYGAQHPVLNGTVVHANLGQIES